MNPRQSNFIKLAINKAKINLGSTGSNPSVGCVVEKENSIISSGITALNGRPHAELIALSKKKDFKGANLYVSLEPCAHYGKTPPCTKIISKKKLNKVFFSFFDPNPVTSQMSFKTLKKDRIKVINLSKYFKTDLYQSYYNQYNKRIPHIDAKIAMSKDFFTISNQDKWITNTYSRSRGHLLRSQYNCILTSYKTMNFDNSMFDCRIEGLEEKSPDLFILDRKLKLKKSLKILKKFISGRKIYIITSSKDEKKKKFFKKKGLKVLFFKSIETIDDYKNFLKFLKNKGYHRILLESGLGVLNYFIKNSLISNLFAFRSNSKLLDKGANNYSNNLIKKLNYKNEINVNLLNDKLYKFNLKKNV